MSDRRRYSIGEVLSIVIGYPLFVLVEPPQWFQLLWVSTWFRFLTPFGWFGMDDFGGYLLWWTIEAAVGFLIWSLFQG